MDSSIFFYCFILFFTIETAWDIFLTVKNISWINSRSGIVPDYLKGITTNEEIANAARYSAVKGYFSIIETIFSALVIIVVISFGLIGTIDNLFNEISSPNIRMALFFITLILIQHIASIPFSIYSTFVIEEKFGFNKNTPRIFIMDDIKGLLISLVLMIPLLSVIIWFIGNFSLWWLYSWALMLLFSLIMMWIFPLFIAPLFNKFSPLEAGELADSINNLSNKTGFSFKEVKVMDASKRSSHSNAYFTGFGKIKRIVLFDTLMSKMSSNEIISVLAHELGHFKMRHIVKSLIISQLFLGFGFFVMSISKEANWIYEALGLNQNSWSLLLCFGLIIPRVTFWFNPLFSWFSCRNEYQADRYAKETIGTGDHLIKALIILGKENLSSPEPHPLFHIWHHSHPTVAQRIAALNN